MYFPVQPFLQFWAAMLGDHSVVARRIAEVQAGSNSDLIPLGKSSARRPQLDPKKLQPVSSFYDEVVLGVHRKFQLV